MELNRVDDAYEAKMAAFEVDCNDGLGEPVACHHAAEFYSVVKDQHDKAAKIYEVNCTSKGYGPSCFNLGRLFLAGKGVPQSDDNAEMMFGKSCETKHLQGCFHKALMQFAAHDRPDSELDPKQMKAKSQKLKEAMKLFEWSCNEGEYESCYFAGNRFLEQSRIDRDPAKAVSFLQKSCALNHAPSCYNLAVLFRKGDTNVPADQAKFEQYRDSTQNLVSQFGGLGGKRAA